jgi:hypothetical protein
LENSVAQEDPNARLNSWKNSEADCGRFALFRWNDRAKKCIHAGRGLFTYFSNGVKLPETTSFLRVTGESPLKGNAPVRHS